MLGKLETVIINGKRTTKFVITGENGENYIEMGGKRYECRRETSRKGHYYVALTPIGDKQTRGRFKVAN